MGRELVSVQAEGTYPDVGARVDLATWTSVRERMYGCSGRIPVEVQHAHTRRPASHGLVLKQRHVRLLFQRRIQRADGHHQTRGFLELLLACHSSVDPCGLYHARAGEGIPAQADAIAVLNVAPLVLESLKVCHLVLCSGCSRGRVRGGIWAPTVELAGR